MDLRSHYPYGLLRHGIIKSYPSLDRDIRTEVTIMGAGISGALVAYELCKAGFQVTVVDRRHVGMGSTAASTSLLQYEIDIPLHELAVKIGMKKAVRSYQLCREAIYKLWRMCEDIDSLDCFAIKPSFQFASSKKDLAGLKKEFLLREKIGFDVKWFSEAGLHRSYGFVKPGGILSADGAEADAYLLTHRLLESCTELGGKVYDHTEIIAINHSGKNISLKTKNNRRVRTRYLVIACGYESQRYLPKKVQAFHSTFAIVSEPFSHRRQWYKDSLIWETAYPYLYLRTTNDHRIMIGGKDDPSADPVKRDRLIPAKARALENAFKKLFPQIDFRTDFKWAGVFSNSKDALPLIGSIPGQPNIYYTVGFGGNGTTCSIIAAEIIRDLLTQRKNRDTEIFSFERL